MTELDERMGLEGFVLDRRGWKIYERPDYELYAGRQFDYVHWRALLSLQNYSPRMRRNTWSAQVNVMFAAGPEDSCTGSLDDCRQWIDWAEKLLEIPLQLAECARLDQVEEIRAKLRAPDQVILLAKVLEVSLSLSRKEMIDAIVLKSVSVNLRRAVVLGG